MNALRERLPQTRIAETTAVRIPIGRRANITRSRVVVDSLSHCFVTASPNNVMIGARSVARLLDKSSQLSALTGGTKAKMQSSYILSYASGRDWDLNRNFKEIDIRPLTRNQTNLLLTPAG
jgi:hypothetical protein